MATFINRPGHFGECLSVLVDSMFLKTKLMLGILGKNITAVMLCPSQCIMSGGIRLQCLITGDVAMLLLGHCGVCQGSPLGKHIFPCVTSACFLEKYFETMQMSCFSPHFCLLLLTSISDSCLPQPSRWCLPNGDFLLP